MRSSSIKSGLVDHHGAATSSASFFDAGIFIGNMKLIFGWFPQHRRGSIVGMILAAVS